MNQGLTLVFLNVCVCVCCGSGIECSDDEALDDGQDEEVSRWEQEQIRKGISIPQVSWHNNNISHNYITIFQQIWQISLF